MGTSRIRRVNSLAPLFDKMAVVKFQKTRQFTIDLDGCKTTSDLNAALLRNWAKPDSFGLTDGSLYALSVPNSDELPLNGEKYDAQAVLPPTKNSSIEIVSKPPEGFAVTIRIKRFEKVEDTGTWVKCNESIDDIKKRIAALTELTSPDLRLFYEDQYMSDQQPLLHYGVYEGSVITARQAVHLSFYYEASQISLLRWSHHALSKALREYAGDMKMSPDDLRFRIRQRTGLGKTTVADWLTDHALFEARQILRKGAWKTTGWWI